ncbi:PAS domain-containing sensor histidine kinase [Methylobacterium flocculans]|uniref:PAS domain-containing sensor histidine kinase n=1 Tax=Methylobacterium flocculans TaxID=2984843 RepID=UPI0021F32607|nr:histidine kinase dimerization/phospho-acceptor domain-containing protein [Methylobacterium sp. FF17]
MSDAAQWLARACNADSSLARQLSDPGAVFLVLDAAGEHILHASSAASDLRDAIAGPDGRLDPRSRIGVEIARARPAPDVPLLLRVQLDPRRIAPPVLMTLIRKADAEGPDLLVLLATTPLPKRRSRPALAVTGPEAPDSGLPASPAIAEAPANPEAADAPAQPPAPEAPQRAQRFTWRSDAAGTVIELSASAGERLRGRMLGRTWRELSESGALTDAQGLIAALAQARTFRSIPLTLLSDPETVVELDLSGSPVDRTGRDFRGFGQVRSIGPCPQDRACTPSVATAPPAPVDPQAATVMPAIVMPAPSAPEADLPAMTSPGPVDPPVALAVAESPGPEPAPAADVSESLADPALSSHEHAAFREIARALGARFAGDDAPEATEARGLPCAVMPFPVAAIRGSDPAADTDAAMIATLERLPAGVLVYRENAILFANRRLLDLTGYADAASLDASGGIGNLFRGLTPHAREPGDTPIVLAARDGRRVGVLVEHSVVDWAGQPAELLLARDAVAGEAARLREATALAQDFADRRGADALAVIDTLDDGIATLDDQGRILALNRSAATLFGVDPREVVGASFLGLFAPDNAVDLLARLHAEPGAAPAGPATVARRGGGRALQVRVLPLIDDPRNRLCAVIGEAPVPSRREADAFDGRRAAEAASVQKSDFLAKVAHEIRTPINGILGFADLILTEQAGPLGSERYREYLRDIHASGTHVLDLVNDLLDLARIEAGRLDLNITEIPLNDVVTRCVSLLQPQAARERIVLRTSFSSDLAPLMADERSVRQAALNVIANAIAFTQAGGQVIVSTTMADRGEIALRVRDTGIGMTADEVDVALQPFRQVRPTGPRRGTGLGLPLTKALVEANQGRFRIESQKDEGTLVEMLFPVDAATKRA